jgi:hypothetical protein
LDVDVVLEGNSGERETLIRAWDWTTIAGDSLLDRSSKAFYPGKRKAKSLMRAIVRNDAVIGRACIDLQNTGFVTVGGLRSGTQLGIAGFLVGEAVRASRDEAKALAREDEIAKWASEQARLIRDLEMPQAEKAAYARLVGKLGGAVYDLPLARVGSAWLSFDEVLAWAQPHQSIIIAETDDAEKALRRGGFLYDNVLLEPPTVPADLQYLYVPDYRTSNTLWFDQNAPIRRQPTIRAIAKGWETDEIEVHRGDGPIDDCSNETFDIVTVERQDDSAEE